MTKFFEEVDKLFSHFMQSFSEELRVLQASENSIHLQAKDEGKEIVISGDIPNALKDNVDVVVRQDSVVIKGENTLHREKDGTREYQWNKFTRAYNFPVKVKSKNARIDFKDGKITVRVPKE
jgi:HSP20 family protein